MQLDHSISYLIQTMTQYLWDMVGLDTQKLHITRVVGGLLIANSQRVG